MKTLKKTLCLVLAVVMVVGVLIFPASAADAPTAAPTAEYNEDAANVLVGMGILTGNENGLSLDKPVTRAEAATFMARLVATPAFMNKFTATSVPYPDCEDPNTAAWAKGAIAFCTTRGIIAGTEKGFEPARGVTGFEMAKMLLCAMGYDAAKEGFYSSSFETNVALLAAQTGIDEGVDNLGAALTRGDVVQMMFNTLFTPTVEYIKVLDMYNPQYNGAPIIVKTYNAGSEIGFVKDNQATGKTKTQLVINGNGGWVEVDATTGLNLVGHVVEVYFSVKNENIDSIYYIEDLSDEVTVSKKLEKPEDVKKAFGDIDVTTGYGYAYSADYVIDFNAKNLGLTNNNVPAGKYVVYENRVVASIAPTAYTMDKVTEVKDGKVTLHNSGTALTLEAKSYTAYDGIAKDHYVTYYKTGDITHLAKAETVTGKLSKIDGDKLTLGGTVYDKTEFDNKSGLANTANILFTDTVVLYLVPDGTRTSYFVADVPAPTAAPAPAEVDVFVVAAYKIHDPGTTNEFGQVSGNRDVYYVQALDLNGNQVIYEVSKTQFEKFTGEGDTRTVNKLMMVNADPDQENNKNCNVFADATGANTVKNGVKSSDLKINNKHYFANTVTFIYVDGTLGNLKKEVKTGVQTVNADVDMTYIAAPVDPKKPEGNCTVSVVFVLKTVKDASPTPPATTYSEVVFAWEGEDVSAQMPYTDADGKTQAGYVHTVYIDGVKTEILTSGKTALKGFYEIKEKTDLLYTLAVIDKAGDSVIGNANGGLVIGNMFNGLITVDTGDDTVKVNDLSVAGATVINVSGNDKVPANAADLSDADTVCMVLQVKDGKAVGIITIYVVASTRA